MKTSTLAASCVALSTAIVQILSDTANFARQVRDARHDLNAINSELLAVRSSLEIIHDDFVLTDTLFPPPLLEAIAGILECCHVISGQVHKIMIKVASKDVQRDAWDTQTKTSITRLTRRLEALHNTLDLALDQVTIYTLPGLRSNSPSPMGKDIGLIRDAKLARALLIRIDAERERIVGQRDEDLSSLECWLAELRICVETMHDRLTAKEAALKRSDSPHQGRNSPIYERNDSALSTSRPSKSGIGAWIDNVASHIGKKPSGSFDRLVNPRNQTRNDRQPSLSTFLADESPSKNSYARNVQHLRSRSRSTQPEPAAEVAKIPKCRHFAASITTGVTISNCGTLHQNINTDKVAISKANRLELALDQRVTLDRDLRNIGRTATHDIVESLLWRGADPNSIDPEFGFLFIRAAFELPTVTFRLLIEFGADITRLSRTSYFSALHSATLGRQLETVQYLVELGTPIDAPNPAGETALHLATRTPGAYAIGKYLLEMGADVNSRSKQMGTPLETALATTRVDSRERSMMIELLMAQGAEGEPNPESGKKRGKGLSVLGLI